MSVIIMHPKHHLEIKYKKKGRGGGGILSLLQLLQGLM